MLSTTIPLVELGLKLVPGVGVGGVGTALVTTAGAGGHVEAVVTLIDRRQPTNAGAAAAAIVAQVLPAGMALVGVPLVGKLARLPTLKKIQSTAGAVLL